MNGDGWRRRGVAALVVLLLAACRGSESRMRTPEAALRPGPPGQAARSDTALRADTAARPGAAQTDTASLPDSVALEPWLRFDFAHDSVRRSDLMRLNGWQRSLVRGIVFGRHGRVFKDPEIQDYLTYQAWYRPRPDFDNAELSDLERHNLDVIREAETESHPAIELGDMRFYRDRRITGDQLEGRSLAELRILAAEVEAVHGRSFDDDPWLQTYFSERYWYRPAASYDPSGLSEIERANLATIQQRSKSERHVALAPGDMQHFRRTRITEQMLRGLSLYELRVLRNEIYALHGMRFRTAWLARYFEEFEWYNPAPDFGQPQLPPIEDDNARLIAAYEDRLHEALTTQRLDTTLLSGLFLEDARRLRFEIYARHGKIFPQRRLQSYFASLPWYRPNPAWSESELSELERRNAELILAHERFALRAMDAFEG